MPEKKWILVTDGTPQVEFLGKTDLNDDELNERMAMGVAIPFEEVRCLRTILMPSPKGFNQTVSLTSISIASVETRKHIKPTGWWWPEKDDFAMRAISRYVENCRKEEVASRSGLAT